jgi:hypothetical protein
MHNFSIIKLPNDKFVVSANGCDPSNIVILGIKIQNLHTIYHIFVMAKNTLLLASENVEDSDLTLFSQKTGGYSNELVRNLEQACWLLLCHKFVKYEVFTFGLLIFLIIIEKAIDCSRYQHDDQNLS